jgi:hypothetical protein
LRGQRWNFTNFPFHLLEENPSGTNYLVKCGDNASRTGALSSRPELGKNWRILELMRIKTTIILVLKSMVYNNDPNGHFLTTIYVG